MQKLIPNLWFNDNAEAAVDFYVSVFPKAQVLRKTHYTEGGMGTLGDVVTVEFELYGQRLVAINGGVDFPFTEAISLQIACRDQDEIDQLWNALTVDGGQEVQCGWLKDKYGLSWQIVPTVLEEMLADADRAKAARTSEAMLKMKKLDIATLERAYHAD